jgi:hypothetical protein
MTATTVRQPAREKFVTKTIRLVGTDQRNTALEMIPRLPLDSKKPLELVVREEVKTRGLDANARMWVGPLKDISDQVRINGRRLTTKGWHEIFKRLYLPEMFDPELCKEGYQKWDFDENGEPILIGSTTELTVKGFAIYLEELTADGANRGVRFTASPNEGAMR